VRRIFFMLTAFYVDNGKNLPLWRELPVIAFWILPSAIGVPLILYALLRSCSDHCCLDCTKLRLITSLTWVTVRVGY
jgi:hypothetical protein